MVIKIALTNNCNLNCKHCYNFNLRNKGDFIPKEVICKLVKQFKETYVDNVQILGGEPLLYPYLIEFIYECKLNNISVWMNTNGTMIDDKKAKELIEVGVSTFIFSIDGPNAIIQDEIRGEGSFDNAINGLEKVMKFKNDDVYISINTVLSKNAIKEIEKFDLFYNSYSEVDSFILGLPDLFGNATNQDISMWADEIDFYEGLKRLLPNVGKNIKNKLVIGVPPLVTKYFSDKYGIPFIRNGCEYCMGGSQVYYLDAEGVIYPCNLPSGINFFNNEYDHNFLLKNCNIFNKDFKEVISRKEYNEFFQYVRARDLKVLSRYSDEICNKCLYGNEHICGISCPTEQYVYKGSKICMKILESGD